MLQLILVRLQQNRTPKYCAGATLAFSHVAAALGGAALAQQLEGQQAGLCTMVLRQVRHARRESRERRERPCEHERSAPRPKSSRHRAIDGGRLRSCVRLAAAHARRGGRRNNNRVPSLR